MMVPNNTWVAVLNSCSLKLFVNVGKPPRTELVSLPTPTIIQRNAGAGKRHRNSEANPDIACDLSDQHVAGVADYLNEQAYAGKMGNLILMTDPKSLGELRHHLNERTNDIVRAALAKDLSKANTRAIERTLENAQDAHG